MKNLFLFLLIALTIASCQSFDDYSAKIETERITKDSSFRIADISPLNTKQIEAFSGLVYFPINEEFLVEARLEPINSEDIIQMKTSTDRLPNYKVYGYVYFLFEGEEHRLTAYQNVDHQEDSLYRDFLFVPFTDNNSTILTYGGGRYLDFKIPNTNTFYLDFNKAYNPYCAYNHRWSCVIPPQENSLQIAIDAGEKIYPDIH